MAAAPEIQLVVSKQGNLRVFVAFWMLGLSNNFTYVIMLSAANDIISKAEHRNESSSLSSPSLVSHERHCNHMSTGAILLADIVPAVILSITLPFLPLWIHARVVFLVLAGALSMVLTGWAESFTYVIIGVSFASASSGLGEVSILAYSSFFPLVAVAAWASGAGAAGLLASFAYAGMTEAGLSPQIALFVNITAPLLFAVTFWIILDHNANRPSDNLPTDDDNSVEPIEPNVESPESSTLQNLILKQCRTSWALIPGLLPLMIPVFLIYFFQYTSISGLFEQLYFTNTVISRKSQFRWFNAFYRIGVFLARSSIAWIKFDKIWVFTFLQGVTFLMLCLEAMYGFIPNVWAAFLAVLIVGLLSGWAYVNTFHNLSSKVPENRRVFSMSIMVAAKAVGTVVAGLIAFPLHDAICTLPYHPAQRWSTG